MLEACLSFPGIDANLPDNEGNTPLHFAAQAGESAREASPRRPRGRSILARAPRG